MLTVTEQQQARKARDLIEAVGGLEPSAEITGLSTSQLGRYQSPTERDSMPLRVIEELEAVTHSEIGHPIVTRYLARRAGYSLLRRPDVPACRSAILDLLARQAKEQGECDPEMLHALADGQIDAEEAERLIPLFYRRLETTAQMLAELHAIAGRDMA